MHLSPAKKRSLSENHLDQRSSLILHSLRSVLPFLRYGRRCRSFCSSADWFVTDVERVLRTRMSIEARRGGSAWSVATDEWGWKECSILAVLCHLVADLDQSEPANLKFQNVSYFKEQKVRSARKSGWLLKISESFWYGSAWGFEVKLTTISYYQKQRNVLKICPIVPMLNHKFWI